VCLSEVCPKKYIGNNLKIVLIFSIGNPYKLVPFSGKYKISDELVKSYCYKDIKEAVVLHQKYTDVSKNKTMECHYINLMMTGLFQSYYVSGNVMYEGNYIKGVYEGEWKYWYGNGILAFRGTYVNGKKQGSWSHWTLTGEVDHARTKTY
jgi:antitoxin component YwqK of YwqJK toxin-antitoxin module